MTTTTKHNCIYKTRVDQLESEVVRLTAELDNQKRHRFGKKSERMPSPREAMGRPSRSSAREESAEVRERHAALRDTVATEEVEHRVTPTDKDCPKCGGREFSKVGRGKISEIYDYIPGRLVKRIHIREVMACSCGDHIVTADGPPRVIDSTRYGPSMMAFVAVSKCADSIPVYRLEKGFSRAGVPMARSTMNTLLHRTAEILAPISKRLLERAAACEIVQADETRLRVLTKKKGDKGYIWTFLGHDDSENADFVAYRYSDGRGGSTAAEVLGTSGGTLVVDAYSGYNRVTTPEGRQRAGCLAHVRRKFFEATSTAPDDAQAAMNTILELYKIEARAKKEGIVGTKHHLELRQSKSRETLNRFHPWLLEKQGLHPPKSPMGKAIYYTLAQWESLNRFTEDARIPVDNNAAERALRVVALGRKNYLFAGTDQSAANLAGLYSIISTCEAGGVNPIDYIQDLLLRTATHPASKLDDLLPHRWQPES